jgi:hypothetical protein
MTHSSTLTSTFQSGGDMTLSSGSSTAHTSATTYAVTSGGHLTLSTTDGASGMTLSTGTGDLLLKTTGDMTHSSTLTSTFQSGGDMTLSCGEDLIVGSTTSMSLTAGSGGMSFTAAVTSASASTSFEVTSGAKSFKLADASGFVVTGGMTINGGLTVNGGIMATDVGITASDKRLKTEIVALEDSLGKVNRLRGVYYKWDQSKDVGHKFDEKRHVGVIAQEVQQVIPELVDTIYDGKYLGVNYPALVPLLIEAIKALDDRTVQITKDDSINLSKQNKSIETLYEMIELMRIERDEMHDKQQKLETLVAKLAKKIEGI